MTQNKVIPIKKPYVKLERAVVEEVAEFLFTLGNQFISIKNVNAAFECFKYTLDLNDKHWAAVHNIAAIHGQLGNREAAFKLHKEAFRMNPDSDEIKFGLLDSARKFGDFATAQEMCAWALKAHPKDVRTLSSLALTCYDMGDIDGAVEWNEKALLLAPDEAPLRLNRALTGLILGDWPSWWRDYEELLGYINNGATSGLKFEDAWDGTPIQNKRLAIISDQGSGDCLQFSRYFNEIRQLSGASIFLYCQPEIAPIMQNVKGVDQVVVRGQERSHTCDHFITIAGIGRILGLSPANCWRAPHIWPDQKLVDFWLTRLKDRGIDTTRTPTVAVVWAGDVRHGNDHARSMQYKDIKKIAEALDKQGIAVVSLQVGQAMEDVQNWGTIINMGEELRDFADTAAVLANIDALVTVDTSVLHLAGSMGVPTFGMISKPPEWRWGLRGSKTPWYHNMELIRQETPRDWSVVISTTVDWVVNYIANQVDSM